jgi:signal transduction histidine kinase
MTRARPSVLVRRLAPRRLWPRRLRARLAVFYALLFFVAGTALLLLTYALVASVLLPASGGPPKPVTPQQQQVLALCKPAPTSVALLDECKRVIAATGAGSSDQRESTLSALKGASVIGLGVLTIASVALGWLVSGRALRPVRSITEAARHASELRLGQRLALTGPDDELKQLADTFDVMLERLDAAFTSQKRFVANAAHELRTPLTAMRTAIEVTMSKPTRTPEQLEAMAARVQRSVERAEATVEALLTLATSELGTTAHEAIDLATAAEDAFDAMRADIDRRGIEVEAALEPARARGDRVLLERMIANLVENAVRHNNPGGWIGIRTLRTGDGATFEIANTGASVSAEQIPTLFEPFARAKQRLNPSDGVGLGLSIADAIAHAHNATITARPRPGGGLEMSVTIATQPELTAPDPIRLPAVGERD